MDNSKEEDTKTVNNIKTQEKDITACTTALNRQITGPNVASCSPYIITLEGSHLGATDTDDIVVNEKHVTFENNEAAIPSVLDEDTPVKEQVIADVLEAVLPHSTTSVENLLEQQTSETRIENILNLLNEFSRNLGSIEQRVSEHTVPSKVKLTNTNFSQKIDNEELAPVHKKYFEVHREPLRTSFTDTHYKRGSSRISLGRESSHSSELYITQLYQAPIAANTNSIVPSSDISDTNSRSFTNPHFSELLQRANELEQLQLQSRNRILDLASSSPRGRRSTTSNKKSTLITRIPARSSSITTERAPCEMTHHTITISSHSPLSHPAPRQRRSSLCAQIMAWFSDFAAALCLCLQVNKDCVFCLGFFVAFVVSASFLTAFFYRTMNLTPQTIHIQQEGYFAEPQTSTTTRLSGFYYVYNRNRPMPN